MVDRVVARIRSVPLVGASTLGGVFSEFSDYVELPPLRDPIRWVVLA